MLLNETSQVLIDNLVLMKAAQFVIDVEKARGKVSQHHIRYAESLKLPILQIVVGNRFQSAHAKKRLEALTAAVEYSQTGDKSARKRYETAYAQADRIALKLSEAVR